MITQRAAQSHSSRYQGQAQEPAGPQGRRRSREQPGVGSKGGPSVYWVRGILQLN